MPNLGNLFKYTYKIVPTDVENVVYLSPTASTWAKAFAPSLLFFGALAVGVAVASVMDDKDVDVEIIELDPDHP